MAETKQRWQFHWNQLKNEVVDTNLCTGCTGCIVACPHDVLGYDDAWHPILENEARVDGATDRCMHGEKACTMCTRACPRFRGWEPEIDEHLWGRTRNYDDPNEVIGVYQDILLVRATHEPWAETGQDGGLCSTILIWCLHHGIIDGALVNYVDENWNATPGVARSTDEVLASAGSRYTYSANPLAFQDAVDDGAEKLALVGMSCQSSVPPAMQVRGARKVAKRIVLNLGLLCSKSFTDDIFEGLLRDEYGLERTDITKMNIKGKLQLWLRDGINDDNYLEVPLKECHPYTRPGCKTCPDFAAEHADISLGGLGQTGGWTLTIVRTDEGRKIMDDLIAAGWIETKDAVETDPKAVELMRKLAAKSRKRWPVKVEIGDKPSGGEAAASDDDTETAPPADVPAEFAAAGVLPPD